MKASNKSLRIIKSERGQSLVELALSITILLTILAGVVDLGSAFFVWIELRDAAQEGAAYASIDPPSACAIAQNSNVWNRIVYSTTRPLKLDQEYASTKLTTSMTCAYATTTPPHTNVLCTGDTIEVTLTYKYSLVTPFASILLPNPINIRAHVTNVVLRSDLTGCP